jgi:hypothetical protein
MQHGSLALVSRKEGPADRLCAEPALCIISFVVLFHQRFVEPRGTMHAGLMQ